MSESRLVSEGRTIPYTPSGSALDAGQVVDLGTFVGVAVTDIADGVQGALEIWGLRDFNKYTGESIDVGDPVYWDEGTNTVTKTSAYSEAAIGKCVVTAASGDSTVTVFYHPAFGG